MSDLQGLAEAPLSQASIVTGAAGGGAGEWSLALGECFCGEGSGLADLLITLPGNKSGNIPVDAIRHLIDFLTLAPVSRQRRVAVILRADCMNEQAANALLKVLEEPNDKSCLVLWSPVLQELKPTLISRCRVLAPPPAASSDDAAGATNADLLAFCGGRALETARYPADWPGTLATHFARGGDMNIGACAADMMAELGGEVNWHEAAATYVNRGAHFNPHCLDKSKKSGEEEIGGGADAIKKWFGAQLHEAAAKNAGEGLDGLIKWVSDCARCASGLPPVFFPAHARRLQELGRQKKRRWLDFYARLLQRRRLAQHALAKELYLREILHDYQFVCAAAG